MKEVLARDGFDEVASPLDQPGLSLPSGSRYGFGKNNASRARSRSWRWAGVTRGLMTWVNPNAHRAAIFISIDRPIAFTSFRRTGAMASGGHPAWDRSRGT